MNIYYIHFSGDPEKETKTTVIDYDALNHFFIREEVLNTLSQYGYCLAEPYGDYNTKFYIDRNFDIKKLDEDSDLRDIFLLMMETLTIGIRDKKLNKILVDGNVN